MAATKKLIPAAVAAMLMAAPLSVQAEGKAVDLITGVINAQIQAELSRMQEAQVWEAAVQANTAQAYRNYLKLYPRGPHAAQAEAKLNGMSAVGQISGPAQTEINLNLTRADKMRIQSQLTAKGYSTNGVDGSFGKGSRRAIATWQRDTGRSVTGYLTAAEAKVLNVGGGSSQPVVVSDDKAPSVVTAEAAARTEYNLGLSRADRVMVQQQLIAKGYLRGSADGIFGSGTRNAIGAWQKAGKATVTGYLTGDQVKALRAQSAATSAPPASETAVDRARIEEGLLSLSRAERVTIQRQLTALGFDTHGADGVFGAGTRNAIARWQAANKLTGTGYLDADQLLKLRGQASTGAKPVVDSDAAAWEAARAKNTVAAYRAYLDAWPKGANAENARQRIEALGGPSDAQIEAWKAGEAALGMDTTTRTLVETRLTNAGYKPGKVDGVFDANTRAALKAYQKAKGLPQTGYMNQGTAVSLMADVFN